jgi:DNA-binding NarL/FixJ family response regulator
MEPINILFADNQFFIREGVVASLKKEGNYTIKTVDTKEDFFKQLHSSNIHLVIMDNTFLGIDNLFLFSDTKRFNPNLKFLLLTNGMTHNEIADFSNAGIYNIIGKTSSHDVFIKAIDYTMRSKIYYSDELLDLLLQHNNLKNTTTNTVKLTITELEIIKNIVKGSNTREIAELKQISYHTVVSHKKNIFRKLSINTCSELILYALKKGILDTTEYHI